MKNIEASVGVIPMREKKEEVEKVVEEEEEEEEEKEEEEEYTEHENEMYFYLRERPEYRIYAVGRWRENQKGEVVGDADTYFRHIMNGGRCDSVWRCTDGWSEQSERTEEIWETLCMRIEETDGLDQIICDEESFEL